jgi:serine/threonine protein phosphatase PrpC
MTLTNLLILVIVLVAVFAAGVAFPVLRGRARYPGGSWNGPSRMSAVEALRVRAAQLIAPRRPAGQDRRQHSHEHGSRSSRWQTTVVDPMPERLLVRVSPDLQPAQTLDLPATRAADADWPPGLAITASTAGPHTAGQQDAYYVQRNLIAVARGLTSEGEGRRAAALALSAIMTSRLGQDAEVEEALRDGASAANRLVRSIARSDPMYSDMVTTLDVVFVALDADRPELHFAHVGNGIIWLQRSGSPSVEPLTKPHAIECGPVLRAVGLGENLVPDLGRVSVGVGDRVFLATASPASMLTERFINDTMGYWAGGTLHEAVTAIANALDAAGIPDEITIIGGEVARLGTFLA